jgi:hypothetical protein
MFHLSENNVIIQFGFEKIPIIPHQKEFFENFIDLSDLISLMGPSIFVLMPKIKLEWSDSWPAGIYLMKQCIPE